MSILVAPKIYFIKDVEQRTRRSRSTLRRMWYNGSFPKPYLLNNRTCWKADVIDSWVNSTIRNGVTSHD